jgi:hypothetical protein
MNKYQSFPDLGKAFEKGQLQDKITNYLKELDPSKSVMSMAIHGCIQTAFNFENVIKLCVDQYTDNPQCMIRVLGEVTMRLILKYDKLVTNEKTTH